MKIEFREAFEKDLEGIINLCNECFNEDTTYLNAKKIYLETKDDPNSIYLVGIIDNQIIAHAKITIIKTIYEDMATYAILNHICVKPEFRRGHIGLSLLDECFKIARKYHCKTVSLWSKNYRTAAHSLYYKYGFKAIDAKFFEKNID